MKSRPSPKRPAKRPYRQGARARAAEQTAERILAAFSRRIRDDWYEAITLEEVAAEAGVTVPTIIRRFGGKEKLLEAAWDRMSRDIVARRQAVPGDAHQAIKVVIEDYEVVGDTVVRLLMQEERFPALKRMNDLGRKHHRRWIEDVFEPWLRKLTPAARRQRVDALVCATDIYIWRLVRRDMSRPVQDLRSTMAHLIEGALAEKITARRSVHE